MVIGNIIVYNLSNGYGLNFSSMFEGDCNMINNGQCFHGEVSERYIEKEFSKINSYHFADKG